MKNKVKSDKRFQNKKFLTKSLGVRGSSGKANRRGERESSLVGIHSLRLLLLSLSTRRYRQERKSSQSSLFSRLIEYQNRRIEHPEGSCSFPYLPFVIFELYRLYNRSGFVFIPYLDLISLCMFICRGNSSSGAVSHHLPILFLWTAISTTTVLTRSLHTDLASVVLRIETNRGLSFSVD